MTIGGDDTLSYSQVLVNAGVPLVAIPKTMDNDVQGTEYCIGFSTAITRAKEAINRQRTTLGSHERIGVFRIFGRDAGFSALYTAYVTSARCVIPEAPYDLEALAALLAADHAANPSHYAFVITAEGAIWKGAQMTDVGGADAFGHRHKANVGEALATELRERTGIETLASELTYDLRSGEPDSLDSLVATTFANVAMDLVEGGHHRADGGDPGRKVRAHGTPRPCPRAAQGGRPGDVQRRALPAAIRRQAGRPDAAGRPRLTVGSTPSASRADRARMARARADMSSSPWPPAIRPVSSWAARALTGRTAPSWLASSRAMPRSLRWSDDLEPERVVVVDHPAAPVGEDPALGRAAAERLDDLLDIEPGLDGEDDPLGDAEVRAGQDHLVDRLDRLTGADRADVGDRPAQSASRTGRARSTSASSPPTKIVSVAFLAPSLPPETGASTIDRPRSLSRAAKSQLPDGAIVEQSTMRVPARAPPTTPSGPNRTASTSGVSETQITTISASATAAAGVSAISTPRSASSGARPGVRFQPVTRSAGGRSWPCALLRQRGSTAPGTPRTVTYIA